MSKRQQLKNLKRQRDLPLSMGAVKYNPISRLNGSDQGQSSDASQSASAGLVLREEFDFVEHGRNVSTEKGLTVRRLLHLGTVKGCPLCRDIQRRSLSQIREYRFSNRHGEVFEVLARCFAYDDDQQPLWDMSGSRTKLFDLIYSPDVRDKVANFFMGVVQSEYGGARLSNVEATPKLSDLK